MKNIIFDLDGTLIDSSKCIFTIYTKLFGELGMPDPPLEVKRTFIGPPVETVMKNYVKKERLKEVCDRFRVLYESVDLKETNILYPGVEDLLALLKSKGKRLFIASTKNEKKARLIPEILGIGKYFDGIYGSLDDIGRISKLDVLTALCENENVSKDDCILVGDTHFDAEGAYMFGIPVLIVKYGFGQEDKLKKYPVYAYADTTEEAAKIL